MENNSFEKLTINLPNGGSFNIAVTPEFLEIVRKYFKLSKKESVEHDHIRIFFFEACNNAFKDSNRENL